MRFGIDHDDWNAGRDRGLHDIAGAARSVGPAAIPHRNLDIDMREDEFVGALIGARAFVARPGQFEDRWRCRQRRIEQRYGRRRGEVVAVFAPTVRQDQVEVVGLLDPDRADVHARPLNERGIERW